MARKKLRFRRFITLLVATLLLDGWFSLRQAYGTTGAELMHSLAAALEDDLKHVFGALLLVAGVFLAIFSLWRLWPELHQKMETEVSFVDLRDLGNVNHELVGQSVTELVAARLQYILRIHDLAYDNFRKYFRQTEIINNNNYSDMTAVIQEFDIQPILVEDPTQLSIGASSKTQELGEVSTKTGVLEAKFSLSDIQKLFKKSNPNLSRLTGSLQTYAGQTRLVGMLANRGKTWGWIIDQKDVRTPPNIKESDLASAWPHELTKELAYHAANRILGETSELIDILPGTHFRSYTDLLKKFTDYLYRSSPDSWGELVNLYNVYYNQEPSNIRTYYAGYVLSILSIYRKNYPTAYQLLRQVVAIENTVIAALLSVEGDPARFGWGKRMLAEYKAKFPPPVHSFAWRRYRRLQQCFGRHRSDHLKGLELAKGLGNINLALGFTLERLADTPPKPGELGKQFQVKTTQQYLEEASDAYQRALDFRPNDPLLLSNYARVLIKRADHLPWIKVEHGEDCRLRYQAEEALEKIGEPEAKHGRNISTGSRRNVKYLFLQKGLFKLYRGQIKEAINNYLLAIEHAPDCLVAQRNLANAYTKQGEYDQAINILTSALKDVGQSHEAQINLERMHSCLHNSRAWAYFLQARNRRLHHQVMDDPDAKMLLGLASDDLDEAYSLLPPFQPDHDDDTQNLKMMIDMNRILVWCEQRLIARSNPAGFNENSSHLNLKLKAFTQKYKSCCYEPFRMVGSVDYVRVLIGDYDVEPFADVWKRSTVAASDYQGFLVDIVCLHDYLQKFTGVDPELGPLLLRCIHGIESKLNQFYLGLDYIRHGLAHYAEECWWRRICDLKQASPFYAKDIWLYLYKGLLSCYFNVGDGSASDGAMQRRADDFYLRTKESYATGSLNQDDLVNLLREAVQLGHALLDNGPWDCASGHGDVVNKRLKRDLRAIFKPINQLSDLVNNA